jgi:hypothetical protein
VLPNRSERVVELGAMNPFIDEPQSEIIHPRLIQRSAPGQPPTQVEVNAFIKVRFNFSGKNKRRQRPLEARIPLEGRYISSLFHAGLAEPDSVQTLPLPPPDFGGPAFDDNMDRSLFEFCKSPYLFT